MKHYGKTGCGYRKEERQGTDEGNINEEYEGKKWGFRKLKDEGKKQETDVEQR